MKGEAWLPEVYVRIRWSWLALLAAQIFCAGLLLILVIIETSAANVDIVKISTLPALFAVKAKDKESMEHCFEENRQVGNAYSRLYPPGIGGELCLQDGRWVLGRR